MFNSFPCVRESFFDEIVEPCDGSFFDEIVEPCDGHDKIFSLPLSPPFCCCDAVFEKHSQLSTVMFRSGLIDDMVQ